MRTRIFVTDIAQWEAVGRAHGEAFGDIRPACTMVEVAKLIAPEILVEIEADAVIGARSHEQGEVSADARLAPRPVLYSRIWNATLIALGMMGAMLLIGTLGYHADRRVRLARRVPPVGDAAGRHGTGEGDQHDGRQAGSTASTRSSARSCMLGAAGFLFAPMIHRILHRFHIEDAGTGE